MYGSSEVTSVMDQRISCATDQDKSVLSFIYCNSRRTHGGLLFASLRPSTGVELLGGGKFASDIRRRTDAREGNRETMSEQSLLFESRLDFKGPLSVSQNTSIYVARVKLELNESMKIHVSQNDSHYR
jgi:hypothetical protein